MMPGMMVWGYEMPLVWLSQKEIDYLAALPGDLPSVEWVWDEMDRVWQSYGLDNRLSLTGQPVREFYTHPVWLMNGIFTQVDPVSAGHRLAIAKYLARTGMHNIADFGGGFGSLALTMAHAIPDARIAIIEPYPTGVARERIKSEPHVEFTPDIGDGYDAIIAQDVLEHVEDPVGLAARLSGAVREGGIAIFANCFHPFIHCHLPSTFHLRHTFPRVMGALGLRYLGVVEGARHAQVFERVGALSVARARSAESLSRLLGPTLNLAGAAASLIRRRA